MCKERMRFRNTDWFLRGNSFEAGSGGPVWQGSVNAEDDSDACDEQGRGGLSILELFLLTHWISDTRTVRERLRRMSGEQVFRDVRLVSQKCWE